MIEIGALSASPETIESLSRLLIDAVAGGAGVSFMHPLTPASARYFWRNAFERQARADCLILGASDKGAFLGTITLILDMPENQPHRGEISKVIVDAGARRRGIARALLQYAEEEARLRARTLLVLDAVTDSAAAILYERCGWIKVGNIPDYAYLPHGTLWPTTVFYKRLAPRT